jgi:hypothetical protein
LIPEGEEEVTCNTSDGFHLPSLKSPSSVSPMKNSSSHISLKKGDFKLKKSPIRKVTSGIGPVIKEEEEFEKFGNLEQIFPFNKLSSNLAFSLN